MCGILGVISLTNQVPSVSSLEAKMMRDRLAHRGPDSAGYWEEGNAIIAHRRLAIRDLSALADQPARTPDGRFVLVYNGELYNEPELRSELEEIGVVLRSPGDTETVLWCLATFGEAALSRMRGMFALGLWDCKEQRLLLARDPLGVKPLYYHQGANEISFASEIPALFAHPGIEAKPDMPMVSAYLSTVRTVLGQRTMFEGVLAVEPGTRLFWDAKDGRMQIQTFPWASADGMEAQQEPLDLEAALRDCVQRHLVSDVPLAAFLSGGLDSSVLCEIAKAELGDLHTLCAETMVAGADSEDGEMARLVAEELETDHHRLTIEEGDFVSRWAEMVEKMGAPLSTPNEVAIYALSEYMREHGYPVVLSGEGADEILGGYEMSLQAAWEHCVQGPASMSGGEYQLKAGSWISTDLKERLLSKGAWAKVEGDRLLREHYQRTFDHCEREVGLDAHPLEAHLRFLRHQNLPGLLQRLDSATMLASVEGRVPYCDTIVATLAEALPMHRKFEPDQVGESGLAVAVSGKLALRKAWSGKIPREVEMRSKHSFPLPFEEWMANAASVLKDSQFAKDLFREDLREAVAANPSEHWRFAWPMINLAMWGATLWDDTPDYRD